MFSALDRMLSGIIGNGSLSVVDADGVRRHYGDGSGRPVTVRIADRRLAWHLAVDPEFAAGTGYRNGRLVVEQGSIYDLLELVTRNLKGHAFPDYAQTFARARQRLRGLREANPLRRARRNAAHHYDVDERIYDLFLDRDRQYSCAYFTPGAGLEDAQLAKKRHIAAKLLLRRGQRVLDIGSGWGGLALYLAQMAGAEVTGITLSERQLAVSRARAEAARLGSRVAFELRDYREVTGPFDRIVSVGMLEHVGRPNYGGFFKAAASLLTQDGVALVHSIGRSDGPCATNPFIQRFIFPGGAIPALSELMVAIERSGLVLTDVEILRLHYAETLRAWRERFTQNRQRVIEIAGDRFFRTWEFYLAGSEAAFRHQGLVVFQLQLAKRVETVPILRDYMGACERRLAEQDGKLGPRAPGLRPQTSIGSAP